MTDEQIVRALECCGNMNECKKECPLGDVGGIDKCIHTLMLDALELIKRQQAEIDYLREATKKVRAETVWDIATEYDAYKEAVEVALAEARAEAVRKFAKFLIDKAENNVIRIGDLCDYVIQFNRKTEKEGGEE